jgi:hypothetical protein
MYSNARSKDLAGLLIRKLDKIIHGNHSITWEDAFNDPSPHRCKTCLNHLACFSGRQEEAIQRHRKEKKLTDLPCYNPHRFLVFTYHSSICLVYDTLTHAITDNHLWGYTSSTSRAIRWYLNALADHFPEAKLTAATIEEFITCFKHNKHNKHIKHKNIPHTNRRLTKLCRVNVDALFRFGKLPTNMLWNTVVSTTTDR